jgi:hypothetical protein
VYSVTGALAELCPSTKLCLGLCLHVQHMRRHERMWGCCDAVSLQSVAMVAHATVPQ